MNKSKSVDEYTPEEIKKAVVAYLASGNSVEDLVDMFIDMSGRSFGKNQDTAESYKEFFTDIYKDEQESRIADPSSFESTLDEGIQVFIDIYNEHEAEANSPVWG